MRLGQAARSFNTKTHKIASLLRENFRELNSHPNVKLTDEEMEFLNSVFTAQEDTKEVEIAPDSAVEVIPTESQDDIPTFIEKLRPKIITLEKEFIEKTEGLDSYKAEKVSLEGLKVLGKIDLPEPKPKEEKVQEQRENRTERKRSDRNRKKRSKVKRELSPAELRAKEQRMAYKKKVEEGERLKTLKKKHYEVSVKSKLQLTKPKKKKKKKPSL